MKLKKQSINLDELRSSFLTFVTYHIVSRIQSNFNGSVNSYSNAPRDYAQMIASYRDYGKLATSDTFKKTCARIDLFNACGLPHKVISSFLGTFDGKRISHHVLDPLIEKNKIVIRCAHGKAYSHDNFVHSLNIHYSIPSDTLQSIFKDDKRLNKILSFSADGVCPDSDVYTKDDVRRMSRAYTQLGKLKENAKSKAKVRITKKYKYNLQKNLYTKQRQWLSEHIEVLARLHYINKSEYKYFSRAFDLEMDDDIKFAELASPTEQGIAFQALCIKALKTSLYVKCKLNEELSDFIQMNLFDKRYMEIYKKKLLKKIETITDDNCKSYREIIFKKGK